MNTNSHFLNQQRLVADQKADSLVQYHFENNLQGLLYRHLQMTAKNILQQEDTSVKNFLTSSRPNPQWYDPGRITRGQQIFKKYAMPVMSLLGGLSLPYCYAASPGNKALYLSEKMRQNPGKRLTDTADFILAVSTPGSLEKNQSGLFHINKTRIIHSVARYYLLKKGSWENQWGLPINQEDMAGTNLAFSYIILRGLQNSAFILSEREKEDFLFLWRYIGHQLHIHKDLLPATFAEASALERAIRHRHFKKSEEGTRLTQELIQYYQGVVPYRDAYLIDSQIRYWLGASVADCVGLPAQPVKDRIVEFLNSFKETANFLQMNPHSYLEMLHNHQRLKASFSGK